MFMRFVGTPAIFTAVMPLTPVWPKLKAVAPTLPYDITIVQDHQRGTPFTPAEWAGVKIPTLVAAGGKSPAWMTNGTRALADALPDARYRTLPGQNHMVKPQAIAPALTEAQQAKVDALATKKGLKTGLQASLEFRQFVSSHTDTFVNGPTTATQLVQQAQGH